MNRVEGGNILLLVVRNSDGNAILYNNVRGGGIVLSIVSGPLGANRIENNFVSASGADGIAVHAILGGSSFIGRNTSVENAGCDINDTAASGSPQNTWTENRFVKGCGAATK